MGYPNSAAEQGNSYAHASVYVHVCEFILPLPLTFGFCENFTTDSVARKQMQPKTWKSKSCEFTKARSSIVGQQETTGGRTYTHTHSHSHSQILVALRTTTIIINHIYLQNILLSLQARLSHSTCAVLTLSNKNQSLMQEQQQKQRQNCQQQFGKCKSCKLH